MHQGGSSAAATGPPAPRSPNHHSVRRRWYARRCMAGDNNLPPPLTGFGEGNTERRKAATEAFGEGLASLDLDALDSALDEAPEETPKADKPDRPKEMLADTRFRRSQPKDARARAAEAQAKAEAEKAARTQAAKAAAPESPALELALDDEHRAHLEPVPDSAHPPQNRRMPTQPGLQVAVPAALEEQDTASYSTRAPVIEDEAKTASYPSVANDQIPLPPPPKVGPSPSPTPVRRGLFSYDRPTNILAGAAIGLLLTVFPAKKMAQKYEQEEVVPLITDLEGAIDHPLGVQAGLVEKPSSIAARIEEGRDKARRRFFMVWLLAGVPIGLGIGFIPRN